MIQIMPVDGVEPSYVTLKGGRSCVELYGLSGGKPHLLRTAVFIKLPTELLYHLAVKMSMLARMHPCYRVSDLRNTSYTPGFIK